MYRILPIMFLLVLVAHGLNAQTPASKTNCSGGSEIAFVSERDGNAEIYVMNVEDESARNISNNPAFDYDPAWSPDGSQLAFTTARSELSRIIISDVDGSNQHELVSDDDLLDMGQPAWSPDGTKIAFRGIRNDNRDIYVFDLESSEITRLTEDENLDILPAWSPDGSQIAFVSGPIGNWQIFVMDADGENQRQLTDNSDRNSGPVWSRDGEWIAFSHYSDALIDSDIALVSPDTLEVINLHIARASQYDPAWSLDGEQLIFTSMTRGTSAIYAMDPDGTNINLLTHNSADEYDPTWRPCADTN